MTMNSRVFIQDELNILNEFRDIMSIVQEINNLRRKMDRLESFLGHIYMLDEEKSTLTDAIRLADKALNGLE